MADTDAQAPRRLLPTVLLVLGILLILTSWTPIGKLESEAVWTPDDSVAYSRLVEENHRIAYEAPERSGLTDEQLAAKRQRIEQQLAAKIEKLEYAKSRPEVWSRNLFWSGALLVTLGGLSHLLGIGNASSI